MMDEEALEVSIQTYQQQLDQVNQAILAAGNTPDLDNLKNDLEELINLTKESLLSLKKSALLKQLDDADQTSGLGADSNQTTSNSASVIDDEYAAFQAMLGDDLTSSTGNTSCTTDPTNHEETEDFNKSMSELYANIVGTKCRAPFVHSWGEKRYGNALIVGVDETTSHDEIPKVGHY